MLSLERTASDTAEAWPRSAEMSGPGIVSTGSRTDSRCGDADRLGRRRIVIVGQAIAGKIGFHGCRETRLREMIVGRLQAAPELDPARRGVGDQVFLGHPERVDLDADLVLTVLQGSLGQQVDLLHVVIGHGEAAVGRATAVNHDIAAGPAHGPVEFVRITQVEREMEIRVRVKPLGNNRVETLGRLKIALETLRSEHSRNVANGISTVQLEPVTALYVELELAALLEYPDVQRITDSKTAAAQAIEQPVALVDPGRLRTAAGRESWP